MDRRGRRPRRATSVLVCAALLTAGCAGSGGHADSPNTAAPPGTAAVEDQSDAEPVNLDTLDLDTLDPAEVAVVDVDAELDLSEMDQVAARTHVLVEQMGPDGAFDAIVFALSRGYSIDAIGGAIEGDRLGVDGTIDDEAPTLATSTLLQLPSPAQGLRAPSVRGPQRQLTIEELRAVAGRFNEYAERMLEPWEAPEIATGEGVVVLHAIAALANAGLSGDQIINAMLLGYGGRADRILQIGMGGALAVCRMVVIGGKPEPIANNSRCDEYGAADRKLRDAFVERGLEYIPCEDASIEGVYDACSEPTAADETTTTTVGERAASGRWTGSATETHNSESRSTTYDGTATVELRDGVYALEYRILSESQELGHDACSSTTLTTGEGSASPADNGRLVFVGDAQVEIVSDCPFYESSGGVRNETTESTKVGYLLDGDVLRLDLLPQTAIEMDRTEL